MWTYNSQRIYVQGQEENASQIIARLQPLNTTTVLQIFGDEAPLYKIDAIVVGESNKNAFKALLNDGVAYNLVGDGFSTKSLYLAKFTAKRRNIICQTIDQAQATDSPVYDVTLELME